ncbi:hypothetical protein LguiB_025708 [Lonicera macranthoides]
MYGEIMGLIEYCFVISCIVKFRFLMRSLIEYCFVKDSCIIFEVDSKLVWPNIAL